MPKSNSTPTQDTVLITGASSGIGRAAALYLAERGYPVVGTSRSLPRLSGLLDDARRNGLPVYGAELDVNNDAAVERAMPELDERHGPIGALVNNAGYGLWGPVGNLSSDELRAQFETNVFAAQRLIRAVLPAMLERRSGTIVNVSSVLGRLGTPFNGAYVASKFALEGLSESLRTELWPFGVRVAVVEPGLVQDGLHRQPGHGGASGRRRLALLPIRAAIPRAQPDNALARRRPGKGGEGHTQDNPLAAARVPPPRQPGGSARRAWRAAHARTPLLLPARPLYDEVVSQSVGQLVSLSVVSSHF